MKILLLEHPRNIDPERCNDIANTPLSSCLLTGYVAGLLKSKGHEVVILEGHLDRLTYEDIEASFLSFRPDILGVHMIYHWINDTKLHNFLEKIKYEGNPPYITAYGFYPTIAYSDILQQWPAIDSVIVGEPELTFAELVDSVSGHAVAGDIEGLAYAGSSGEIVFKKREPAEKLDDLPFPVRTEAMLRLPEVNLQGSRGCYGSCTFCYINPFYGNGSKWRGRDPASICEEIKGVISMHGKRDFYFTDPNFFGLGRKGQERAGLIATLLKPLNIRFGLEGRVNDIHDETIGALAEAGLRHILIGLESGSDSSLKRMNKMTTVAQNENAIKVLRRHGIEPNIGFIMFEPDSTLDDIKVNFDFLVRNDLLKNLPVTANVLYHHQIILKGTPAYRQLKKEGRLNIRPSSTYEGVTSFIDPRVAALAHLMRRITNFLFTRMAGIWSGKIMAPINAREKYARANQLLLRIFEENLKALMAGHHIKDEQFDAIAGETESEMGRIL